MESLPLIKLFMDIMLAGTVMYLAFRVARSRGPSPAQVSSLQALEENLVRLLREAGNANTDLQKALAKEQKRLEELLFDIETVEHRVNKGIREAQSVQRELKRSVPEVGSVERQERQEVAPQIRESVVPQHVVTTTGTPVPAPQPVYVSTEQPQRVYQHERASRPDIIEEAPLKRPPTYAAASEAPRRPLRESIERRGTLGAAQIEQAEAPMKPAIPQTKSVQRSLEDIYARCEELLRAGASIQQVANVMSMTVDEIHTLQQVMEVEDDTNLQLAPNSSGHSSRKIAGDGKQENSDPRLGVLVKTGSTANPINRTREMVR